MRRIGTLMFVAVTAVSALGAQVPVHRLQQRNAVAPDGFSGATAIQELPDGRVIVADSRDQLLYLVDFASSRVSRLGRTGSGPNEYESTAPAVVYRQSHTYSVSILRPAIRASSRHSAVGIRSAVRDGARR